MPNDAVGPGGDSGGGGLSVRLHVYDLSNGMAASMSSAFLGFRVDVVPHTGVVVAGSEFWFNADGVQEASADAFREDTGLKLYDDLDVGRAGASVTSLAAAREALEGLKATEFPPGSYSLTEWNGNNFSERFLECLGAPGRVPGVFLELPDKVLRTPFGLSIVPMIEGKTMQLGSGAAAKDAELIVERESGAIAEQRRCPDDGRVYSLAAFRRRFEKEFGPEETLAYWSGSCEVLGKDGAAAVVSKVASVVASIDDAANAPALTGVSDREVVARGYACFSKRIAEGAATTASTGNAAALREWLREADNGLGYLVEAYLDRLLELCGSLRNVESSYALPDGGLDQRFYDDVGVRKLGHRRFFERHVRQRPLGYAGGAVARLTRR